MQLRVLPTRNNSYPKRGLLVKGNSPQRWLEVIHKLRINLDQVSAYAIPSRVANELYGCLIIDQNLKNNSHLADVLFFQCVHNNIFIPEYTAIHPFISKNETERLFSVPHIFHPDFGWYAMEENLNWLDCIQVKKPINVEVLKPMLGTPIPKHIYKLAALAKDEKDMEKNLDLPLEKLSNSKLNALDKMKLGLLSTLFKSNRKSPGQFDVKERGFMKLFNKLSGNNHTSSKWSKSMDSLMNRNSKQADRLLALFAKNPQLAMKFAIPLDLIGSSRDSGKGLFSFGSTRSGSRSDNSGGMSIFSIIARGVFIFMIIRLAIKASTTSSSSGQALGYILGILLIGIILYLLVSNLFKSGDGSGGTATIHDDRMEALRKQYEKLIEEEKKKGDYRKAAAMQIKLLGNHWLAAETLNEGKYYEEAAYIHLKYNKNKQSAAECYANGQFYDKAIALYKELKDDEKVGDLYKKSGDRKEANTYFKKVIDKKINNQKDFLTASKIYQEKIEDPVATQAALLLGWRTSGNQSLQCIETYFGNITNLQKLEEYLLNFYKNETNSSNIRLFIKALKKQKDKSTELQQFSKKIMYDIISTYHKTDPGIAFELSSFDGSNNKIQRDSTIFVREEKKKKKK